MLIRLCSLWIAIVLTTPIGTIPAVENESFLAGQLLVATTEMRDTRFAEAVIYLVKHGQDGAFGLIINRPLAKGPYEDLLKSFGADPKGAKGELIIHYGGPVGANQGFVLHSDDILLDSSIRVKDGIAMTADVKIIEAMARGKGPKQSLVMFGYAGWAPGQLEMELKGNSWFVLAGDKSLIFGKDAEKKWRRAVDKRQIPL